MKLSEGVEASLHACTLLAGLDPHETISGADLALCHGVSTSYLLKHLKKLVDGGVLQSVPGPYGGFKLARAIQNITFLDIVLAVEGRQPAFRCTEIRKNGPSPLPDKSYPRPCGIKSIMLTAEQAWRDKLAQVTLADAMTDHMTNSENDVIERGCAFIDSVRRPKPKTKI